MSIVKAAAAAVQNSETAEQKEHRQAAYMRDREALRQRSKLWRLANSSRIKRRQKRYRRQVEQGMRVQMDRIKVGNSYVVVGLKTREGEGFGPKRLVVQKVERL